MKDIRIEKLEEGMIIPISFDYHFVRIFGQKENMDILEYFISDFYDIPIKDVTGNIELLSRNLKQDSKIEKSKQVDLLLSLNDKKINIEISNSSSIGRKERDLVYLSKIHGGQLKYRDDYSSIGSSWQIRLNNIACNGGRVRRTYYMISNDEDRYIYSSKFRIDNIDLVAASKMEYNEDEKLIRWCRILRAKTRDEIIKELGDEIMDRDSRDKLLKEVDRNSRNEEVYELYEKYSREEMERRTELKEAIERTTKEVTDKVTKKVTSDVTKKVKKQSQVDMAKKMIDEKIEIDIISKVTGLSKSQIEKL